MGIERTAPVGISVEGRMKVFFFGHGLPFFLDGEDALRFMLPYNFGNYPADAWLSILQEIHDNR